MLVPVKTFQTSYILTTDNTVDSKIPNSKICGINLTHCTMQTPQNVLKMSTVSPDKQRDSDATDWWLQQQSNGQAFCI